MWKIKSIIWCIGISAKICFVICNEWRDKEGEVIIDQGTKVDMRGTEIIFTTGVSVTGGASLHAYLGYTGVCNDDMSQRNGESNSYIPNKPIQKDVFDSSQTFRWDAPGQYTFMLNEAISSDEKWNTAIKELKPEKRQKEKKKGLPSYFFNLGIALKARSFLKKFME